MDSSDIDSISLEPDRLELPGQDPIALAGGVAGVLIALTGMLLLPVISRAVVQEPSPSAGGDAFEYIEARLLKLGEIKDDKKLPDRIVPPMPTAPEEIIPLDMDENRPEVEEEQKPEKQPDAEEDDVLRQVFEKARAFAEIQDNYIPEGHPDGVPDGDVTDPALASMGATYGRRITAFIKERWIVPTLISDDEKNRLNVKVTLKFDADMVIVDVQMLRKSGNRLFDDSVMNAIELVRKEVRNLPEPPDDIASRVYGGGLTITLYGADAPVQ